MLILQGNKIRIIEKLKLCRLRLNANLISITIKYQFKILQNLFVQSDIN